MDRLLTTVSGGQLAAALSAFEQRLGDPLEEAHPLSWRAAVDRDEREAFPEEALAFLHEQGSSSWQIPAARGGRMTSFEQPYALSRAVSRRDAAVSLTSGMQTWSQLVWMAGSEAQQQAVEQHLLASGLLCLAVSEPDHGADLLANEMRAEQTPDGFILNGKKQPIGAAARAPLALVLARTESRIRAKSLSWFLVDKRTLPASSYRNLPGIATHGLRAAELAGVSFHDAVLPAEALVGPLGSGLELVLKLFQITRTLITGLALGMADTALRLAASFALNRILYGAPAADLPVVREQLVAAYLDLIAADLLAVSSVRGMHFRPDELSVTSLIAKTVVPGLTGRVVKGSAEVLGARFYLREGFAHGMFQKILRDHAAVGLIDGSSAVCLSALCMQLPSLLGVAGGHPGDAKVPRARFTLTDVVPPFDYARLELLARGSDEVVQALPLLDLDAALCGEHAAVRAGITGAVGALQQEHRALATACARLYREGPGKAVQSPLMFALARRYATAHAAAAAVGLFAHNRQEDDAFGLDAVVLTGVLSRLLQPDRSLAETLPVEAVEALMARLRGIIEAPRALSVFEVDLPYRSLTSPMLS